MNGDIKRILIIKPSSLGDVVNGLAIIGPLRRRYPGARIDWVVGKRCHDLLLDVPSLNRLLLFDRDSWRRLGSWPSATGNFFRLVRAAREARYDIAIDLQGLLRSALIAFLSGARTRIGFSNARELGALFYNRKVTIPQETMHAVDRYLLIAKELGADAAEISFPLEVSTEARRRVREILKGERARKPIVVVNPTARWEAKRWPSERYAMIGDHIRDVLGGSTVIIGGEDEKDVVAVVTGMMKGDFIDLSGELSLRELTALLAEADGLVTNDTGPMHIAAALGTPVVAIFGPTDPARTGPYGRGHRVVRSNVMCSPCFSRVCNKGRLECMESVSIEDVTKALESLLNTGIGDE